MSSIPEAEAPEQLPLPYAADEESFRRCIVRMLGTPASLTFTDNATSMISVKRKGSVTDIRVHRMFLAAGTTVIKEMAAFIMHGKGETPLLRMFIRNNSGFLKKNVPRRRSIRHSGRYHDLMEIYRKINAEYFGDRISAEITWGTGGRRRVVRRRTLGTYNSNACIITVNPVLDRKNIPRYFIEFIVYHEMLHADMGVEKKNGRRSAHHKEFRERERQFREYERAISWEKKCALS